MSEAKLIQRGDALDVVAGSEGIAAGTVIVNGALVGVVNNDIPANASGAMDLVGVYSVAKNTDAAISVGGLVYFDTTNRVAVAASTAASTVKIGVATEAAGSGATIVKVRIG